MNGVWTGNVTVNAVDPTVTLQVGNGSGAIGTSNTFATQPGPVASFQASTLAATQYQDAAFPVTLTAKDANGYTVTNFSGTANVSGMAARPQTRPSSVSQAFQLRERRLLDLGLFVHAQQQPLGERRAALLWQ